MADVGVSAPHGPTGVKPRLCDADLQRVEQALLEGASAHGFTGQLWTLARIAQVIQRLTAVRYHPGHLWAVLHQPAGLERATSHPPRP
jgi:transposase